MPRTESQAGSGLSVFFANRGAVAGLFVLMVVAVVSICGPLVFATDPFDVSGQPLMPPGTGGDILGTDHLGRSILSQMLHGGRITLMVGLLAALVSISVGILIGAASGFWGGWIDSALMRITEGVQVMPSFLLAIVIIAMTGPGLWKVILVIGMLSWPTTARLVRAQFLSLREYEFVDACYVTGVHPVRIMLAEILPNALAPAIAVATLDVSSAILMEAGLSFLGLGDPSAMSWGAMLELADQYITSAWWMSVFPGLAIFIVIIALNLVGNGLSDIWNPRSKKR